MVTRPVALFIVNKFIHNAAENAGSNDYPLIDPARKFIPQNDYIVNIQPLRNYLNNLGDQYPDSLSIYYEQLNSGANISINRNLRFYPASLSKLAQALIVADEVNDGNWKWDKEFTINQSDIDSSSGYLYKSVKAGDTASVDELLNNLMIDSDNTSQNIFRRNIPLEKYTELQAETGLEDLFDEKGDITTKEYSRMLRVLYTSSFLERKDSEKILDLMARSSFHDYLSQGIPDDIKFAHKYGENKAQSIFSDSGIVYVPGHPYLVTVMIHGKDSSEETRKWAVDLMKDISTHAYESSKEKLGYVGYFKK